MIKDVQSEIDTREITIDKVGVKKVKLPIIVLNSNAQTQHTVAEIDLFVSLHHTHRATHMSRFIQELTAFTCEPFPSCIQPMLTSVKDVLETEIAYLTVRFPYFIERVAPVSKQKSLLDYIVTYEAILSDLFTLTLGVVVPITALCPCSKEISDYGAHNQRSYVMVKVRANTLVWPEEIINIVEGSGSCGVYPLLKRPDEKYVTEYAYQHPAFVEDIVRSIAERLKADPKVQWFYVESENIETVHNHNAFACIQCQL